MTDKTEGKSRGAVIGKPVMHSKSPVMQLAATKAAGIDASFTAVEVERGAVKETLRKYCDDGYFGVSVTTPHKLEALEACDELTLVARTVGAVNCVSFYKGRLVGHNTDSEGFADAVVDAGVELDGAKVVLLGAGGAARAIAYGLEEAGATVTVVARSPREVVWKNCGAFTEKNLAKEFADTNLLVDCTPTGLESGGIKKLPAVIPLKSLPAGASVASLVYHRVPEILTEAKFLGFSTMDGKEMLVRQGALAFEIWFDEDADLAAMRSALNE